MEFGKEEFRVTEDHIKLLQHVNISFNDGEIDKVPGIDTKRPFGNGDFQTDIAEILGWEISDDEEMFERAEDLLRDLKKPLQIVLNTLSFKPGLYVSEDYGIEWKLKDE